MLEIFISGASDNTIHHKEHNVELDSMLTNSYITQSNYGALHPKQQVLKLYQENILFLRSAKETVYLKVLSQSKLGPLLIVKML